MQLSFSIQQGNNLNLQWSDMPMKTIKVNPVRYQILTELTKSSKFSTIENYLGDLIDSTYAKKK